MSGWDMTGGDNKNSGRAEDLTGQDRFARNLAVSWISQLVMIFSGFVMPRLVDEKVGQVALGIWDFGWSFVSYLSLLGLGMGACFNRFIAKHRAAGDIARMNRVANSVQLIQILIGSAVILTTLGFYSQLPYFFADTLAENTETARRVILFLGLAVAVQMLSGCARGMLTGYHRWDIHNALHAGSSLTSLVLMVAMLYLTPLGVSGMAIGYLAATLVFEYLRFMLMKRVCHEFQFQLSLSDWKTSKEMLLFGIKSMLSNLPPILLLQTISIMLVSISGPAALAVFTRPMALIRHLKTFIAKFTLMLTPTTGSMQGQDDEEAIRKLYLNTTRLNLAFSLLSLGALFAYGDWVLRIWMGDDYAHAALMMLLAAGHLLPMSQDTSIRILMGMNRHGRISIAAFVLVFAIFAVVLGITGLTEWRLVDVALLLVIPLVVVYGLLVPFYTCRCLTLSFAYYWQFSIIQPVAMSLPYFAFLLLSRYLFNDQLYAWAAFSAVAGGLISLGIYFHFLAAVSVKRRIKQLLRMKSA